MPLSAHTDRHGDPESGSLVIFTRLEGLLREPTHAASVAARDPLRFLASQRVPVVLVSAWNAAEIRQLQHEFAFNQPFICEEGAALHVPRAWLTVSSCVNPTSAEDAEWEVFRFSPPNIGAAFELVSEMFVARGHDPLLTVGIGCSLADYALLASVDIPIVIRDEYGHDPELLHHLPGVYITSASGTAGWSEAVLGVRP